jgi:hypothetical protein
LNLVSSSPVRGRNPPVEMMCSWAERTTFRDNARDASIPAQSGSSRVTGKTGPPGSWTQDARDACSQPAPTVTQIGPATATRRRTGARPHHYLSQRRDEIGEDDDVGVHQRGGELALRELRNPRHAEHRFAPVRAGDGDLATGQPTVAHNSSRIVPFSTRPARLSRTAIVLVMPVAGSSSVPSRRPTGRRCSSTEALLARTSR